jgi:hypothetical protein
MIWSGIRKDRCPANLPGNIIITKADGQLKNPLDQILRLDQKILFRMDIKATPWYIRALVKSNTALIRCCGV